MASGQVIIGQYPKNRQKPFRLGLIFKLHSNPRSVPTSSSLLFSFPGSGAPTYPQFIKVLQGSIIFISLLKILQKLSMLYFFNYTNATT